MPEPGQSKRNDVKAWTAAVDNAKASLTTQQARCVWYGMYGMYVCMYPYKARSTSVKIGFLIRVQHRELGADDKIRSKRMAGPYHVGCYYCIVLYWYSHHAGSLN